MPAYERELYLNIPLYARLADDIGLVEHICESIQPNIDAAFRAIEKQEFLYNPEVTPREWLQFLGQFVGLAIRDGKYLGFGINPNWSDAHTRDVISRAWAYWQIKGTELGIREAIALWLEWDRADSLTIRQPFSDRPTDAPTNWWTWDSTWDSHLVQTYQERRHLGGEQLNRYRPNYQTVQENFWYWEWNTLWCEGNLDCDFAPDIYGMRSHLGPHNSWLHFRLQEWEWVKIFPDFHELAPEIFPATAMWETFGWIKSSITTQKLILIKESEQEQGFATEFDIKGWQYGEFFPILDPKDVVKKSETVKTIDFGVWQPFYWFGQMWSPATTFSKSDVYIESVVLEREIAEVDSLVLDCDLAINIDGFIPDWEMGGEWFYKAFYTYEYREEIVTVSPAIPCLPGISINLGEATQEELSINLSDYDSSILVGAIDENNLVEPVNIANFFLEYDNQYFYHSLDINNGFYSPVGTPINTLVIDSDYWITVPLASVASDDFELCNIFGLWSDLSISNLREVAVPRETDLRTDTEIYPILGQAMNAANWKLIVETTEKLYILMPTTMFWYGNEQRSQVFSFENGCTNLYLEFLLTSIVDTNIYSCTLWLLERHVQNQTFYYPLNDQLQTHIGFQFNIPFGLSSGAGSPAEELTILEILPKLQSRIQELDNILNLITNQPVPLVVPTISPATAETANLATNLQEVLTTIDLKLEKIIANPSRGDAHFIQEISIPTTSIVIRHGLGKLPSVTFVSTIEGSGEEDEPRVTHLDENTVLVEFAILSIGRVFFN